ncbi:MAG: hypothetical protein IT355_02440 [Gemmatimonadaceae bacterium]|nr:hypothetical protein [Gemmatimonadaceae bacterium]
MHYGRQAREDSVVPVLVLLGAVAALAVTAIAMRRRVAPRRERRTARALTEAAHAVAPVAAARDGDAQDAGSGSGALVHRRYEVRLVGTGHTVASICRLMHGHLAELAPSGFADFEKTRGDDDRLRAGDEYDITMLGPWNGRVRVAEVSEEHFTLVTLDGHPEAGHITFSARDAEAEAETPGAPALHAVIESWARARDGVVDAAYSTLGIGRQVQTEVWVTFLQRLATLAGVSGTPEVRITTEELATPAAPPAVDA